METVHISAKETGALIRSALRKSFPATRFQVRMSRGTGYGTFYINWTDGPTKKQVEATIGRFEGASFNGMTDSTEYHEPTLESLPDGFRQVRYGTKFLLTTRSHSDAFTTWATEQEARYWADYERLPEWERRDRLYRRMSRTAVTANGYESTEAR